MTITRSASSAPAVVEPTTLTAAIADQILHISCRLQSDLIPARKAGMKTALLVAEKDGLEVAKELLRDPATRPDRLLTELGQVRDLLLPL